MASTWFLRRRHPSYYRLTSQCLGTLQPATMLTIFIDNERFRVLSWLLKVLRHFQGGHRGSVAPIRLSSISEVQRVAQVTPKSDSAPLKSLRCKIVVYSNTRRHQELNILPVAVHVSELATWALTLLAVFKNIAVSLADIIHKQVRRLAPSRLSMYPMAFIAYIYIYILSQD